MYKRKNRFMTYKERYFYNVLKELEMENNIIIQPQINLTTVINKKPHTNYYNDLYRNIDFGIFSNNYEKLLLLIEINDKSHNLEERKKRDKKVKKIVNQAGINLITFHTKDPNEKKYIKERVIKEINIQK